MQIRSATERDRRLAVVTCSMPSRAAPSPSCMTRGQRKCAANFAWSAMSSRCDRNISATPPIASMRLTSGAANRGESTRMLPPVFRRTNDQVGPGAEAGFGGKPAEEDVVEHVVGNA